RSKVLLDYRDRHRGVGQRRLIYPNVEFAVVDSVLVEDRDQLVADREHVLQRVLRVGQSVEQDLNFGQVGKALADLRDHLSEIFFVLYADLAKLECVAFAGDRWLTLRGRLWLRASAAVFCRQLFVTTAAATRRASASASRAARRRA